ncbi:hypothetical protein CYJ57_03005 [Falseniella ignava]|uniref:Gp58-like domain-containing protein n=1 Tax=Falseniella ignava TaxID=137730 RepID=A0A2I1K241_9LACT|nr:gp58-like family protein [Falseniella ignava]PKY89693.1 hypothetical protein CYJ57_03005 [Falseniella ignava]
MKINLNDLTFKDGKYTYTFTPERDMQSIELESDCYGDLAINHMQVERNPDATYFVPPEVYEGNLSGIFKNLKEINAEMKDEENSELWSRIRINVGGMMRKYHHDHISTEIVETANGIGIRIDDVEKSLKHEIAATSEALQVKLSSTDSRVTQLAATANGIQLSVKDLKSDTEASINQLKGLIDLKVTRSQVEGIIRNSGDSIYLAVKDKIPDSKMTASEIKSALNLSRDGVRIQGKNIMLDGNSYISSGVIKDAHIGSLNASKINAGTINAANVRIINLDINNLTGNRADFIQTYWNGINSRISINANGLTATHRDGSKTIINAQGLYTQVGGTNYHTHYLMHIQEVSNVLNDGSDHSRIIDPLGVHPWHHWVQLPAVFKGKRFKAIASISDTMTFNSPDYSSGRLQLLRTVCYVDAYDYENAKVGLVGYAHVYEPSRGKRWNYPIRAMVSVTY